MTTTLHRFAIRTDRPVDVLLLDILRRVDAATRRLGIEYFVGGALARDLILWHVFGKETGRATHDVDLGICVDDWSTFDALRTCLTEGGGFSLQPGVAHRLIYRPVGIGTDNTPDFFPLDLLPFGGVEHANGTIAWPPGRDVVMNVAGFAEARTSALTVDMAEDLAIPVISLPSLAVLKLIAWCDRHTETVKDATDFLLIARRYAAAGNLDRLYETEPELLRAVEFDPDLAGAILLGKDAAAVCGGAAAKVIVGLFANPRLKSILMDQLLRSARLSGEDVAKLNAEQYIAAFLDGFGDATAPA